MKYEELQILPEFYLNGPNFRYTINNLALDKLIKYLTDALVFCELSTTPHYKFAESIDKNEPITKDHPYYQFLLKILPENNIQTNIQLRNELFNNIKRIHRINIPVEVSIYGNKVLQFHGYHRLVFAYYLGIKSIDVSFLTTDLNLINLATILFSIYEGDLRISIYQPVITPYFELCPIQHIEAEEKAISVTNAIKDKNKTIIDVGAHLGYYSRFLIKNGFRKVISVDFNKDVYECQKYLNNIGFIPLDYYFVPFQEFISSLSGDYSLVALSVFHSYLQSNILFDILTKKIAPWVKENVSTLVVEHNNETDDIMCAFWIENCNFVSKETIYFSKQYSRKTNIFTR